jgi:hypothetical protein
MYSAKKDPFRSVISFTPAPLILAHNSPITLMGSCFAANMAYRLNRYKFKTICNPLGIIYNPVSLAHSYFRLFSNTPFTASDITQHNSTWFSYETHSEHSSEGSDSLVNHLNTVVSNNHRFLQNTTTVCITFGTAWVYKLPNNVVVANCHKQPASQFSKALLTVDEIVSAWTDILTSAPTRQFLFTVSPVRYLRDGVVENQHSKATLLLAVRTITERFNNAHYFPAYEIMMDDLRDYRFYESDLLHPTKTAIDYIWNIFEDCFIPKENIPLLRRLDKLNQALAHRPLHPKSVAYREFVNNISKQIQVLQQEFPALDLRAEKELFKL